jgi:hypothetical protein
LILRKDLKANGHRPSFNPHNHNPISISITMDEEQVIDTTKALPDDSTAGRKRPRSDTGNKKRKQDPYKTAYQNFTYTPIPSTGRPGTPHRFFAESYDVVQKNGGSLTMRIHTHRNGLCVVTAGDGEKRSCVESFEMHSKEAPASSAGAKRKQQSAMLRGKERSDTVRPDHVLCTLLSETGEKEELPCAVWGTLLEINPRLSVNLLRDDPLLSGYLAVVLPTGPFPPPSMENSNKSNLGADPIDQNDDEEKRKKNSPTDDDKEE